MLAVDQRAPQERMPVPSPHTATVLRTAASRVQSAGGRARSVRSTPTLAPGGREVLLIVALYLASELSRGLAGGGAALAEKHAASVVRLERRLHVFHEAAMQRLAHHIFLLPTVLGYAYLTLHTAVTAAVLIWVYRRHRSAYPTLRNALLIANLLAVFGYWLFPTAPPRLAGIGITDTVSSATSINLTSRLISGFYNPYAAVPSIHIAYALIVGLTIVRLTRKPLVHLLALAYPLLVLLVIVATGNHFFFDAAAGAAVALLATRIAAMLRAPTFRTLASLRLGAVRSAVLDVCGISVAVAHTQPQPSSTRE